LSRGLIIISGATGFIGRPLALSLAERAYDVAVLTRSREKAKALFGDRAIAVEWDGRTSRGWLELAESATAIINLAGENIGAGRWNEKRKQSIVASRLNAGKAVMDSLRRGAARPKSLIQASAIGFYGPRSDEELDETSPPGDGFLAEMVRDWEASTREAEDCGTRRIVIRSGLVLGRDGGVLPRFLGPFRFFVGGPLGSGNQWLSWIHRDDEIAAIRFLLERPHLAGVFNLTAPGAVTMKEFARTLGRVMKRPSCFPVPAFLLRWLFGDMADETMLAGQRILPSALLKAGYEFLYPDLGGALEAILRSKNY
jgi:uncharacterized protein (TIGR01777 family)